MNDKPSYLGLLNAIANAETCAEGYLDAWAATTKDEGVRRTVGMVARREGEHGKAFAKRIWELGYEVRPVEDPTAAAKMKIASSKKLTDREKFEKLGLGKKVNPKKPDFFTAMFNDTTIDIGTGELLGRYIAEERDSGRMLQDCYTQLKKRPDSPQI